MARHAHNWIDAASYHFVVSAMMTGTFAVAAIALYGFKSALGIDLFDGPSFLHCFYLG